jgi:hypothetical protein
MSPISPAVTISHRLVGSDKVGAKPLPSKTFPNKQKRNKREEKDILNATFEKPNSYFREGGGR